MAGQGIPTGTILTINGTDTSNGNVLVYDAGSPHNTVTVVGTPNNGTISQLGYGTVVYMNLSNVQLPAAALTVTGFPNPTIAGATGTFTVTAVDGLGRVDTSYTGTIQFPVAIHWRHSHKTTFTESNQGTMTFSATLRTVGLQSITATDTTNSLSPRCAWYST